MNDLLNDASQEYTNTTEKLKRTFTEHLYSVVIILVIAATILISLGALDIVDITWDTYLSIIINFVPFYIATLILDKNNYLHGASNGKKTESYINASKLYSAEVNSLSGDMLDALPEFAAEYNEHALHLIQEQILREVSLNMDVFNNGVMYNGQQTKPLKVLSKQELHLIYNNKIIEKAIIKARSVKIKGINAITLTNASANSHDPTDMGKTEKQLERSNDISMAIFSFGSVLVLSLIGIKDFTEWGWMALLINMFKILYILAKSYMKYFKGYRDITIEYTANICKKYDTLKQFKSWYNSKKSNIVSEQSI